MTSTTPPASMQGVKALVFDVFGTVVQVKQAIRVGLKPLAHAALSRHPDSIPQPTQAKARGMSDDEWAALGMAWYDMYMARAMAWNSVPAADREPYKPVDEHNAEALRKLLPENGLDGLFDDGEIDDAGAIWYRLNPWADSVQGLSMLKTKYPIVTLSDGNVRLLRNMAEYGKLPWSEFFGGDTWQAYKPDPKVYLGAAEKLGLKPEECALVAAHLGDLKGAKECGMHTVYVERAGEERWSEEETRQAKNGGWLDACVDVGNEGLITAARRLGCAEV